jgi:Protein of unknown function (DUF2934)
MNDSVLDKLVWDLTKNALRNCIHSHGPITEKYLDSATKRVLRAIVDSQELRDISPDVYYALVVDSLEHLHKHEINPIRQQLWETRQELKKAKQQIFELTTQLEAAHRKIEKENIEKIPKSQVLHQITKKLAMVLWYSEGQPEGQDIRHWLLAERLALALMAWKPRGKLGGKFVKVDGLSAEL